MILCNPRISSLKVQSGPRATTAAAAAASRCSSDDLPRLPSAAAIVGNAAFLVRAVGAGG